MSHRSMPPPLFVTVEEASKLLRLGRTVIYERIKSKDLIAAKFGSATRISFASIIRFANRGLSDGNGEDHLLQVLQEAFPEVNTQDTPEWALRLCYIHQAYRTISDDERLDRENREIAHFAHGNAEKNSDEGDAS